MKKIKIFLGSSIIEFEKERNDLLSGWRRAVKAALAWAEKE